MILQQWPAAHMRVRATSSFVAGCSGRSAESSSHVWLPARAKSGPILKDRYGMTSFCFEEEEATYRLRFMGRRQWTKPQ